MLEQKHRNIKEILEITSTHAHTHTHTHTHTYTCTCITTARIGAMALIQGVSQQKTTRLVAPLAAVTPASSMGLQDP